MQMLTKTTSPSSNQQLILCILVHCGNLVPVQQTGRWQNLRKMNFVVDLCYFRQKHENLLDSVKTIE